MARSHRQDQAHRDDRRRTEPHAPVPSPGPAPLTRPPLGRGSRSSAETRYRELRHLAFQAAQDDLAAAGGNAELRAIDATALTAFGTWPARRVAWPWPDMAADWRRGHPDRFELAVWSGDALCALALGRPSPGASHMALYFMEGSPDPGHPLRRKVATVVITALRAYAIALGKGELRLVDPLPEVIPFYCSPAMGFELVRPRMEAPYCRRSL